MRSGCGQGFSILKNKGEEQGLSQDLINACPNINFKISARPDLATYILQILIPTTSKTYCVKKGILHFSYVLEDGLLG